MYAAGPYAAEPYPGVKAQTDEGAVAGQDAAPETWVEEAAALGSIGTAGGVNCGCANGFG